MWNYLKKFFHKPRPSSNIIAAKVTKIDKHPNADRLRVITLSDGQNEIGPVVCGAFNFTEGDIVALALPGAQVTHNIHSAEHEPFTLEKATIRGVESQGMICSAFEIGKADQPEDKPEIMVLPPGTPLGKMID